MRDSITRNDTGADSLVGAVNEFVQGRRTGERASQRSADEDIQYLSSLSGGEPVSEWIAELANPAIRKQRADELIEWVFNKHGPNIRRIAGKLIADRFREIISADSAVDEALVDIYKQINQINPKEGEPVPVKFRDREGLIRIVITAVKRQICDRVDNLAAAKRNPVAGVKTGASDSNLLSNEEQHHDESKPRRVRLTGEIEGDLLGGGQKPFHAQDVRKRDYRPPLSVDSDAEQSSYYDDPPLQLLASWLAPDLLAIANEAYEWTKPDYRPLVDLAMQGLSREEIAEHLGMSVSAVRRRWEIVKEQWQGLLGLDSETTK